MPVISPKAFVMMLIYLSSVLWGCDQSHRMPLPVISGTVMAALSQDPIADAEVRIISGDRQPDAAITTADGFYRLRPTDFSRNVVVCEKSGYVPDTAEVMIYTWKDSYQLNFQLQLQ